MVLNIYIYIYIYISIWSWFRDSACCVEVPHSMMWLMYARVYLFIFGYAVISYNEVLYHKTFALQTLGDWSLYWGSGHDQREPCLASSLCLWLLVGAGHSTWTSWWFATIYQGILQTGTHTCSKVPSSICNASKITFFTWNPIWAGTVQVGP